MEVTPHRFPLGSGGNPSESRPRPTSALLVEPAEEIVGCRINVYTAEFGSRDAVPCAPRSGQRQRREFGEQLYDTLASEIGLDDNARRAARNTPRAPPRRGQSVLTAHRLPLRTSLGHGHLEPALRPLGRDLLRPSPPHWSSAWFTTPRAR